MYKILIADDDDTAREGLRYFLNWEQFGFTVDGLFEDGSDVITYLENHDADVVLADIRMYDVSGLELAQYMAKHHPHIKVIVISGYSEFEYLRESIRLGVIDYLLKPITQDELTNALLRSRAQLDAAQSDSAFQRENLVAQGRLFIQAVLDGNGESEAALAWEDLYSRTPEMLCRSVVNDLLLEVFRLQQNSDKAQSLLISSTLSEAHLTSPDLLASWTVVRIRELLGRDDDDIRPNLQASVEKYVTEHISVDFTVEDMAHSLFFNSDYLAREFKRLTGEGLANYIIRRRMTLAMSMLQEGECSIAQVAQCCGYSNAHYFNQSFKKYTNMTAREWRARKLGADGRE